MSKYYLIMFLLCVLPLSSMQKKQEGFIKKSAKETGQLLEFNQRMRQEWIQNYDPEAIQLIPKTRSQEFKEFFNENCYTIAYISVLYGIAGVVSMLFDQY